MCENKTGENLTLCSCDRFGEIFSWRKFPAIWYSRTRYGHEKYRTEKLQKRMFCFALGLNTILLRPSVYSLLSTLYCVYLSVLLVEYIVLCVFECTPCLSTLYCVYLSVLLVWVHCIVCIWQVFSFSQRELLVISVAVGPLSAFSRSCEAVERTGLQCPLLGFWHHGLSPGKATRRV